jgi:hypothetical protein
MIYCEIAIGNSLRSEIAQQNDKRYDALIQISKGGAFHSRCTEDRWTYLNMFNF